MLNPRRANSPLIRASTPGLFSARIESTCRRPVWMPPLASRSSRLRISFVPGSPMSRSQVAGRRSQEIGAAWSWSPALSAPATCDLSPATSSDHVPRGLAGGDHRIAVLLLGDVNVEHHRAVGGEGGLHRLEQLALVRHAHADGAEGVRE